ncbi:MAG: membrane dipeptidase [Kiritimatiellia bacterium]|nr:membrane dipeptidase [Kiritimatiellia bacterium]
MDSNLFIDQAKQCALKLLKPDKKDVEHGLELHRNSLVVESFGFGPQGYWAMDAEKMLAAIHSGASGVELKDLSEDIIMTGYVNDAVRLQEFKVMWEASGVTCIFRNAGEESQSPTCLIKRLAHYVYVTDRLKDFLPKALNPSDIILAKKEKRHCLCLACNGVPIVQDWNSVEDELRYISIFFHLGCRMMHLTYNRRNMLGDGCAETANGGLSDFGRTVIAEMNRVGIIVDVAHSGWQTSLEAAQVSRKPIVASHTTCAALNRHIRSKPDEVIRAIVKGGGLVGICAIPAFLGGTGDINAMLDHIDYMAKTFGVDHIAIGTDVCGSLSLSQSDGGLSKQLESEYPKGRSRFENFWPPNDPLFSPEWQKEEQLLSLAWVNFPFFTVGLVQRGYSDADIQKILGGNMLRVFNSVLPESERKIAN